MCLLVGLELSRSLELLETAKVIAGEWLILLMDMHVVF
jgi:hypothetical protein